LDGGFFREAERDIVVEDIFEDALPFGAASTLVTGGSAKASSAKASVTRLFNVSSLGSTGEDALNWNFVPRSCRRENSSKEGNRAASSSAAALLT
jgi:hypothetical protein